MQLVFGVSRGSIMSATLENMVLALEHVLTYNTNKVMPTSGSRAAILDSTKMQLVFDVSQPSVVLAIR
jgi:hypothetical protein